MRKRDSLTDRVTATLERPLHVASDTASDLVHRGGEAIAELAASAGESAGAQARGPAEKAGKLARRQGRSARRKARQAGETARREAARRAEGAREQARKEARRQRKRFFRRRRHVQALAAERVDGLKTGAVATAGVAAGRAADAASAGAEQARTLAGEARSWLAEQAAGVDLGGAVAALAPTALSKPERKRRRPLTTIAVGAAAGLVGMAAMDAVQRAVAKVAPEPASGGDDDGERDPWQDAPSPAKIGKRIWEGVLRQPTLGPDKIGFATNVVHFGYGITLAAAFSLIEESRDNPSPLLDGAVFGLAAWAFEEYLLPRADVSPPAKTLSAGEHAQDLAFHLAYGLGVGATVGAADARRS